MKTFLRVFGLFLVLWYLPAQAVDRYYSDCGTGAHLLCDPGDDLNDGLSSSAPKQTAPVSTQFNAASCGDRFFFARGSWWDGYVSGAIGHAQNCATNPVIFAAYDPPSGATGDPVLYRNSSGTPLQFGSYDNTSDDRGYLVEDLWLQGTACRTSLSCYTAETGVALIGRLTNVTLNRVTIKGFRLGMEFANISTLADPSIEHITISNSTISDNYSMGILGSADDWAVYNTLFEGNNFTGNPQNHAIYVNAPTTEPKRITFRNNRFINNSIPSSWAAYYVAPDTCTGGTVTVHGVLDGVVIEDNYLQQSLATINCYGVSVTQGYASAEVFNNVIVSRNKIINYASAIVYENAPGIIIDNNEISTETTTTPNAYIFSQGADEAGVQTTATIRNNSVYGYNGVGINCAPSGSPTGQTCSNNLIYFWGSTGTRSCFAHTAKSTYTEFNGNLCYGATRFSSTYTTLGTENDDCPSGTASFDCTGLRVDPLFVATPAAGNDWSLQLQSGSPALGGGASAGCARLTKDGKVRTGTCTPGAFQPGL